MDTFGELPEPYRTLISASQVSPAQRQQYVSFLRQFLETASADDLNRRGALSLICETMEFNFEQSKSINDADASVQANKELIALLEAQGNGDAEALSQAYHNFSVALSGRSLLADNQDRETDLDNAITNSREAVAVASQCGNPELLQYQSQLSRLLRTRSERRTAKELGRKDMDEAVSVLYGRVEEARKTKNGLDSVCNAYGLALQARYDLFEDLADLDQAIDAHGEAAMEALEDNLKGGHLSNMANARLRRFDHNGSVDDDEVDKALEESLEAVRLTSLTYHDRPGRLINLSNVLQTKFERGGRDTYLYRALQANREAVSAARVLHQDRRDHAECLGSLGMTFERLFQRTRSERHIDDAIKAHEEAITILERIGESTRKYDYALCQCLRMKGKRQDLDDAIVALEKAIGQTSPTHKDQLTYLTVKANIYGDKFALNNQLADLSEMVRLSQLVVDQCKARDITQFRAAYLTNLAVALAKHHRVKLRLKGSKEKSDGRSDEADKDDEEMTCDLDSAIKVQEEALSAEFAGENHPLRATCLHNLGMFLADRYVASNLKRQEDRTRAIEVHIEALQIETALPSQRIKSARRAMHLIQFGNPGLSAQVMRAAVELLPLVSPPTLDWTDQQREIAEFAGLASRAAVMALEAKWSDYEALRLLELGRGVMMTLQLGLRADLERVTDKDGGEELALRFKKLRGELNAAPASLLESIPVWQKRDRGARTADKGNKHAVWDELRQVTQRIRDLDGLASFNDALTEQEMTNLAAHEHIVVLNADSIRSDAFLVTCAGVRAIHLDGLKLGDIEEYAKLTRRLAQGKGDRHVVVPEESEASQQVDRGGLGAVLKWLWDKAVKRILLELGIIEPLSSLSGERLEEQPPRIWWVTSGWLSMLPIHAAGDYSNPGSTTNALDMVISSYAPTMKSRQYAVEKARKFFKQPIQRALLISMEDTKDQPPLPGAKKEIAALEELLTRHQIATLTPPCPTITDVLAALPKCQLCHFACHGYSHPSNPSLSQLVLAGDAPLLMRDVAALDLGGDSSASLAYLSACWAADAGAGPGLLDEGLHVAGAFLLAGFAAVVGTLWRIPDLRSVLVAEEFYRGIGAHGTASGSGQAEGAVDVRRSARALNRAVRVLRTTMGGGADTAAVWAPYIHLGV